MAELIVDFLSDALAFFIVGEVVFEEVFEVVFVVEYALDAILEEITHFKVFFLIKHKRTAGGGLVSAHVHLAANAAVKDDFRLVEKECVILVIDFGEDADIETGL